MKVRFELHVLSCSQGFDEPTCVVLAVYESVGHVDPPVRKGLVQRAEPLADPRLSGIDLLSAPHETNDHRPVPVPIEAGDEELGLRLAEIRTTFLAPHEVDRLLQVPGALGFVEDGDVFDRRRPRVGEAFVAEL